MEITQLTCHDGNLMFDRKVLKFKILDRGYGKAAELQEFLERSNDLRILFFHNNRWLGAVKRDEHLFRLQFTSRTHTSTEISSFHLAFARFSI